MRLYNGDYDADVIDAALTAVELSAVLYANTVFESTPSAAARSVQTAIDVRSS
jgi:hypothetical protein